MTKERIDELEAYGARTKQYDAYRKRGYGPEQAVKMAERDVEMVRSGTPRQILEHLADRALTPGSVSVGNMWAAPGEITSIKSIEFHARSNQDDFGRRNFTFDPPHWPGKAEPHSTYLLFEPANQKWRSVYKGLTVGQTLGYSEAVQVLCLTHHRDK